MFSKDVETSFGLKPELTPDAQDVVRKPPNPLLTLEQPQHPCRTPVPGAQSLLVESWRGTRLNLQSFQGLIQLRIT